MGADIVAEHIQAKSNGTLTLQAIEANRLIVGYPAETRRVLGIASRIRGSGWFKSVTTYQKIGKEIVGPNLATADLGFRDITNQLWNWTRAPGA